MNTMNMKMRRGLMCQSPGATAVCMTGDSGSVIVPRRPDRASFTGTSNNTKYTRLVDQSPQRFGTIISSSTNSSAKMIRSSSSIPMPHLKRSDQNASVTDRKALQKPASIPMPPLKRRDENASVKDRETLQKPAASSADQQLFQVVVMRVSLHCQGCAGKVKKHISKMEGVTSFSIDLESKRVTVMGHVSPVGVLESISKVKRAEFWPF